MRDFTSELGANLRKARNRLNLTQAQVAETVDLTAEVYGRLERGQILPGLELFVAICRSLGVTPDQVLGFAPLPASSHGRGLLNRH